MQKRIVYTVALYLILSACNNFNSENNPISKCDSIVDSTNIIIEDTVYYIDTFYSELPVKKEIDTLNLGINLRSGNNYKLLKSEITNKRQDFYNKYISLNDTTSKLALIESASDYITQTLLNDIFPYWYGTIWDFNGYTSVPNDGVIACGYFVSTTLRDVGFNLNRYHLAQQSALNEAKTLQVNDSIRIYSKPTFEELKNELINNNKEGLYMVGLDCHVGYILIYDNDLFFIHSNYVEGSVMLEYASTSPAFLNNQMYVISDISYNYGLIEKWILNSEIQIVRE